MATAVDICNMALANLGDAADVTSIDPPEGSVQAERCARFYPLAASVLLESHEWGFATRREALPKIKANDRSNWLYRYALPATCLKVIDISDGSTGRSALENTGNEYGNYEIGVGKDGIKSLYSNMENAELRYVARVDAALFTASFSAALSWKMSAMLAGPILKGSAGAQMAKYSEEMAQMYLQKAIQIDASQHQEYQNSSPDWILGR